MVTLNFSALDGVKGWREIGYSGPVDRPRVAVQRSIRTPAGAMLTRASFYSSWSTPWPIQHEVRSAMHPWVQGLPRCEATCAPETIADENLTPDDLPELPLADWEREATWQ